MDAPTGPGGTFEGNLRAGSFAIFLSMKRTLLLCWALQATALSAQSAMAPADSAKKAKETLFTARDAYIAAGFVGLTFALYPVDRSMAQRMKNANALGGKSLNSLADGFDYLALPGVVVMGVGAYTWGRLAPHPDMADFGLHTTEAVVLAVATSQVLKLAIGRSRPYVSNDTNPRDFKFGGGFSSDARRSFPSGHATVAFAAAAAATSEVHRLWPKQTMLAGTLFYGSATLVGLARMYQNQHWASDVVLGAGIGTLTGLKTVRYSHLHPDNYVDRVQLGYGRNLQVKERSGFLFVSLRLFSASGALGARSTGQ